MGRSHQQEFGLRNRPSLCLITATLLERSRKLSPNIAIQARSLKASRSTRLTGGVSSSSDDYIHWTPKRRISLPAESTDEYMAIPICDFQRLQKLVNGELRSRADGLPAAYFALFGATVAIGAAIPPVMAAGDLPTWIVPTFIASASACFVLGITLVVIARTLERTHRNAVAEIAQEMSDIDLTYRPRGF